MADEVKSSPDDSKLSSIVRQFDVIEIYLADRDLRDVESFGKYKNLQRLWLNGNKLRRINCLQENFCLTEVYLQDNLLIEITGAFRHLGGLEVLMLQGNQLKKLTDVVHELKKMQRLRVLNLFGNPLAQDYDYRNYVVHNIASLKLLDRQEIIKEERDRAQRRYGDAVAERIKDTLAFGRRLPTNESSDKDGMPQKGTATHWENTRLGSSLDGRQAEPPIDNSSMVKAPVCQVVNNQSDPRVNGETHRRSLMQYSSFDWTSVPSSKERRLNDETISPRILKIHIR